MSWNRDASSVVQALVWNVRVYIRYAITTATAQYRITPAAMNRYVVVFPAVSIRLSR
jgi:hypothetical protein